MTTKFDIEQNVWLVHDCVIKCGVIKEITINRHYNIRYRIYITDCGEYDYDQESIGETKEELKQILFNE